MDYKADDLPFASGISRLIDAIGDDDKLRGVLVNLYEDRAVEAIEQGNIIEGQQYRDYMDHLQEKAEPDEIHAVALTLIRCTNVLFAILRFPLPKEES